MDVTDGMPKAMLRDFEVYAIGFVIWGALFSSLQPVTPEQIEYVGFWSAKAQQILLGVAFGLFCTMAFTLLQNGINQDRWKPLSRVLAIGTWLIMSFALPYLIGRFG